MAVNPQKILRQAAEFVDRLSALEQLPGSSPGGVETAAEAVDRTWAVPALVSAWNATLADRELAAERPEIKRALISVLRHSQASGSRSTGNLLKLLSAARQAYAAELKLLVNAWNCEPGRLPEQEQVLRLRATGDELQTAPDARGLVSLGFSQALLLLAQILDGSVAPSDLAAIAPVLSRVPVTERTRDMWFGVYMRFAVLVSIEHFNSGQFGDLSILPQQFYNQASRFSDGAMLGTVSATADDIRRVLSPPPARINDRDAESVITMFPLHESGPYYVTSFRLVMDSIAPWILRQVHDLDLWKCAVSIPFEQKIIATLQKYGFTAGPVEESGYWNPYDESSATKKLRGALGRARSKPPGEIDVLAYRHDALFLIEAKSILGFGRNISDGPGPADLRAWRSKLEAKANWLTAQGLQPDLTVIVLEGIGYLSGTEIDAAVPIISLAQLENTVASVNYQDEAAQRRP